MKPDHKRVRWSCEFHPECERSETERAYIERDDANSEQRHTLADIVRQCEVTEQCLVCGELLPSDENDNGDGEILGHQSDCAVGDARALLAKEGGTL